jgi:hypothetical protein
VIGYIKRLLSHESAKPESREQDFAQTQQFVTLVTETRQNNQRVAEEVDRLKELLQRVRDDG